MSYALSSSPPVLPIPRQPSPLSFSSVSAHQPSSPPDSTSSYLQSPTTEDPSPSSSRLHNLPGPSTHSNAAASVYTPPRDSLPIDPLADSLLLRSTFNALEHSAATLKRLSKSVLAATSAYLALLEQVERAEDDVFGTLGELGRWLEGGYGVRKSSVWDHDGGIRKIRKDARKREREEMEVMVEHGLRAVKADLKRNGLVGGGAHARFENTAKQFYNQTSAYLSPNPSSSSVAGPSTFGAASTSSTTSHGQSHNLTVTSTSLDRAQSSRLAQFDLARYSHHSTLLYAVPPTSIACLDLLVGLYSWAGGLMGEFLDGRSSSAGEVGPVNHSVSTTKLLKESLSSALESLAGTRSELLQAWAKRNQQTVILEQVATERQQSSDRFIPETPSTLQTVDMSSTSISASGIEHKKPRKMHKLHRSVGGKLRELLSSSGSSTSLAHFNSQPAERVTRASFDGGLLRSDQMRVTPLSTNLEHRSSSSPTTGSSPCTPAASSSPNAFPVRRTSMGSPRPRILSRHSMHSTRPDYISPFIASQASALASPSESSPDLRLLPTPVVGVSRVGGVGGLGAGGDEDELREEAGRKKEGVLWGTGAWEGLTKGSGKGRWEKFWVVLDRSKIYEYRDNGLGKPESAFEVIDLKFASVREGRGTDRRFVFEIVTPTQGRRLYQATSEYEMKQWLYAICNAIESCINGTSSVRTFDASKLRTVSGSLDDHAVPTRQLLDRQSPRVIGLGLPMPSMSTAPATRQSMPPLARSPVTVDGPAFLREESVRQRKPSLKKVLRQSAEIANEKWNNVVNNRYSTGGLDLPRQYSFTQNVRSGSRATEDAVRSTPKIETRPTYRTSRSSPDDRMSRADDGLDVDIEKRVLEMAGLGLGMSPGSNDSPNGRRVRSDGAKQTVENPDSPNAVARTRSVDTSATPTAESRVAGDRQMDMQVLREIADSPQNKLCADCGKGMKSSRWATLSLRDTPMVVFLCIRCVGIHRSLGTHISKPRSVDLDIWNKESIVLAGTWGNERGNAIWEYSKPGDVIPRDEHITEFIKAKYVEGRWLDESHRMAFGLHASDRRNV